MQFGYLCDCLLSGTYNLRFHFEYQLCQSFTSNSFGQRFPVISMVLLALS